MRLKILSFGFKHGPAPQANFLFDVRRLPNPYTIRGLGELDGLDEKIQDFVLDNPIGKETVEAISATLATMLSGTRALTVRPNDGKGTVGALSKARVTIAFGCTGGHHRSVALAEVMGRLLKDKTAFNLRSRPDVQIMHRDLAKE